MLGNNYRKILFWLTWLAGDEQVFIVWILLMRVSSHHQALCISRLQKYQMKDPEVFFFIYIDAYRLITHESTDQGTAHENKAGDKQEDF